MNMYNDIIEHKKNIAVIGLGYVGLPLAAAFSKYINVIGFDINREKIKLLKDGQDPTRELGNDEIRDLNIRFTSEETDLVDVGVYIVAVPTPIASDKNPDLSPLIGASEIIGRNINKGSIVIYESTVYPGVTEDICVPVIEKISGLQLLKDFHVGYSPERINPADKNNRLSNIVKIVSADNDSTLEQLEKLYSLIIEAGVYRVGSIKAAEAAKLAENMQRDINIAFMNELAMMFDLMKINTNEVLNAMNTKWNSLKFSPGLVGGHCIGVDPYYYIYKAKELGFDSKIVSNSRIINDSMGAFIANKAVKLMINAGINVKESKIYILGATFKENCPDTRNSKVSDIINNLKEYGTSPILVDPVAENITLANEFKVETAILEDVNEADCIILAVAHDEFKKVSDDNYRKMFNRESSKKVIVDVKNILHSDILNPKEFIYWSL